MILSVPESRLSRMWIKYLDDSIQEHIVHENFTYLIDIKSARECGVDMSRVIEEATKKFGAERIDEN